MTDDAAERRWIAEREWDVPGWIRAGLGVRPAAWWRFESRRPDLAEGAGAAESYDQLRGPSPEFARTVERLRYLVDHGLLTGSERSAIMTGNDDRHRWRRDVLDGREPSPTPFRFDELDPWVDLYRDGSGHSPRLRTVTP
jgi:hypothetical protein